MQLPRGIKVISIVNLFAVILYVMMFYLYGAPLRQYFPYAWYLANLTLISILILQVILFTRWQRLLGFGRLLIYVMAMLQGLQVMLLLKDLFTVAGLLLVISGTVLVIYFIGIRGYLNSQSVISYFGLARHS